MHRENGKHSGVCNPLGKGCKEATIVLRPKVRVMPVFWAQERYPLKRKTKQTNKQKQTQADTEAPRKVDHLNRKRLVGQKNPNVQPILVLTI